VFGRLNRKRPGSFTMMTLLTRGEGPHKNENILLQQLSYSFDLSSADLFLFPELKLVQNDVEFYHWMKYKRNS
jgi:hypothetical protein